MAKVLVVDDAAFMRMRCGRFLAARGHEVVEAGDGATAVKMYRESRPDAVLMDVTMPRMDGLTALKEIRRIDPAARVAMVTAMGQPGIVVEALKSGARDFVTKPFEAERLIAALDRILA
jgi:two-component system chemotaxis response regulator CheY